MYGTSHGEVFEEWWQRTARTEYLGFTNGDPAPVVTFYYDPTIDHHHRLPVSLGGLFPAYYLAATQPDDARALFDAGILQMGLSDPSGSVAPPGPRGTAIVLHLAREWGMDALAVALQTGADERYEPTWDHQRGEFTWGFGLNEPHPRGQYNAAMAAAEVMSVGAWWRLVNSLAGDRFDQPTVTSIDFPDFTLTAARWDPDRRRLVLATAPKNDAVVGQPTRFRIANLGDPARWTVDAHGGAEVAWNCVGADLEVVTTIGAHNLVVRPDRA